MRRGLNSNSIKITLDKQPTRDQWEELSNNQPCIHPDDQSLEVFDAEFTSCGGLDNDWEKIDLDPAGVIGFLLDEDTIYIRATENIPLDYFQTSIRYLLSQLAQTDGFSDAKVTDVKTVGLSSRYSGNTLAALSTSVELDAPAAPNASANKPKTSGGPKL